MPTEEEIDSALDVVEIERLVSVCTRCSLHKTKTKDVPGSGNSKAKVLFIGEAPGKEEDLSGEPFVGAAGKVLTEMIEEIGWKREDVYISNVLKHRPPSNRDPKPKEIAACWPYLKKQIDLINPRLIVFLGRHAMNRFFPEFSIANVHGKAFKKDFNGKEMNFLALYHPTVARFRNMREVLKKDFIQIPMILTRIENEEKV